MDDITVKISGTFKGKFEEVAEQMPEIEKSALYRGAYYLRDKIRQQLASMIPKATVRNPKYNDTLVDAVGFTRPDGASVNVNALGVRRKGSGTFRTRFFEQGTKERYQKKINGVKLKRKRWIGSIKPTHFFSTAVQANTTGVQTVMRQVLEKYITEALNK